jgi:hypothetical protein
MIYIDSLIVKCEKPEMYGKKANKELADKFYTCILKTCLD